MDSVSDEAGLNQFSVISFEFSVAAPAVDSPDSLDSGGRDRSLKHVKERIIKTNIMVLE